MGPLIMKQASGREIKITKGIQRRFWEKVQKTDGCWLWIANKNDKGYGTLTVGTTHLKAHRLSYLIHHGELPGEPLVLCHQCDTPACVNPAHLRPGTRTDNNNEMRDRGRGYVPLAGQVFGEDHPLVKLSEAQVHEIYERSVNGDDSIALAVEFGISVGVVSGIRRGRTWKHLGLKDLGHGNLGRFKIRNDLSGRVFESLTVIRFDHRAVKPSGPKNMWLCRCVCNNEVCVQGSNLTSGNTTSCGKGPCHGGWNRGRREQKRRSKRAADLPA